MAPSSLLLFDVSVIVHSGVEAADRLLPLPFKGEIDTSEIEMNVHCSVDLLGKCAIGSLESERKLALVMSAWETGRSFVVVDQTGMDLSRCLLELSCFVQNSEWVASVVSRSSCENVASPDQALLWGAGEIRISYKAESKCSN